MALSKEILKKGLLGLFNSDGFPESYESAATAFSEIIEEYATLIVPPSTTKTASKASFISSFLASKPKESIEILVDAVKSYCLSLASGMVVPGFVIASPVGGPMFLQRMEGTAKESLLGLSAEDWCEEVSQAIDFYFRTGTMTNIETGAIIPWS